LIHPKHNLVHQDLLQFHLPVLYQIVGSPLQDSQAMHPCLPLYAMITTCGVHKATHVKPKGYAALAIAGPKARYSASAVIYPDADDFVSTLNTVADSGQSPATGESISGFPPSQNVTLPSLQLSSKLLTQNLLEALSTRGDWSYVVDGFAPEDLFQVPSTTYLSPLSKNLKTRCVESKTHGDGPKCSKSPAKSYFQDAPAKIDVSQLFTYMESKTLSIAQLERLRLIKSLTLLIAISGDVASFPYDRGKMDLDYFPSILTCMQLLCQSYQDFVKQDLCICFHFCGECLKNVALIWLRLWFYYLWGVTDKSMGSDSIHETHFAKSFSSIASSLHPDPAWMWITQESHIPSFLQDQVILFGSMFASRWFALFSLA